MEAVFNKEIIHRLAVSAEHGRGNGEVVKLGVSLGDFLYGLICLVHFWPQIPPLETGLNGDKDDVGFWECPVNFGDKFLKVGGDDLGGLAVVDVIVAGVEKNDLGLVGDEDAVGVEKGVFQFRAPKSAVDGSILREGFFKIPHAGARGSDKEIGSFGWRALFVSCLKLRYVLFPLCGIGGERREENEEQGKIFHSCRLR